MVLRQRGPHDFLITIDGRVLMTSAAHRSEQALAQVACLPLAGRPEPSVLIGGLGMGYTLRAALDALPERARVVVAEIEPAVARWCEGPLAALSDHALSDSRASVEISDVASIVTAAAEGARARFDAIALDLFEGPRGTRGEDDHPLYGRAMLARVRAALTHAGTFAVWSEEAAPGFEKRLVRAGFDTLRQRVGRGGRHHLVYRATPGPSRRR